MSGIIFVILLAIAVALIVTLAASPFRSRISKFERQRLAADGDQKATADTLRDQASDDISSILRVKAAVLLVIFTSLAIVWTGVATGILLATVVAIFSGALARSRWFQKLAHELYQKAEVQLVEFVTANKRYLWWIRYPLRSHTETRFHSIAEIEHALSAAGPVLSDTQKQLVLGALRFDTHSVKEKMTPITQVKTIKKTEILGPLVLDDLHRSGHDSFPVTDGDSTESIIGTLRLKDVQTLDTTRKHTSKVETAMNGDICYVAQDQNLLHALKLLVDSQHHLLVVVDDSQTVTGIITLADIIKTLFGTKR